MSKKKTHSEYVAELQLITSNIEVIGQYVGARIKIKHRCKICGYEWETMPNCILNGGGCPECAKYQRAKSNTKTHTQYVTEVASINSNIEVIGRYTNADAKIKIKCKICDNEWFTRAIEVLRGHGCPKCSQKALSKTHEQYVSELATINSNVVVIDKYINSYTKIKHFCLKCGYEWSVKPNSILQGNCCPKCSTRRKSHEQYVLELAIKNPNIEVVDEYINANTNILHNCKICNHKWMIKPSHVLCGSGCPSCQETSGEQQIRQWLISNDIRYEYQKCFIGCRNKRSLPFDFYIPNYNCCIEYDGSQHFKEVDYWGGKEYLLQRQHNDKIKNEYCKKNDIFLIRIRYNENVSDVLNKSLGLYILNKAL